MVALALHASAFGVPITSRLATRCADHSPKLLRERHPRRIRRRAATGRVRSTFTTTSQRLSVCDCVGAEHWCKDQPLRRAQSSSSISGQRASSNVSEPCHQVVKTSIRDQEQQTPRKCPPRPHPPRTRRGSARSTASTTTSAAPATTRRNVTCPWKSCATSSTMPISPARCPQAASSMIVHRYAIDATREKRRCEKKLCPWTIKEGWKHTYLCSRACFKETCIFQ